MEWEQTSAVSISTDKTVSDSYYRKNKHETINHRVTAKTSKVAVDFDPEYSDIGPTVE